MSRPYSANRPGSAKGSARGRERAKKNARRPWSGAATATAGRISNEQRRIMNHEVRSGAAGGCPGSPRLRAALRLAPRAAIGRPCGAGESIAAVLLTRRPYAVVRTRSRISLAAGARQKLAGPGTGNIRRHLEPKTWNCRSYLTPWATQHILGLSRRGGGRAGSGTIRSSWRGPRSICRAVSCPAAQADQGKGNEKSVLCPPNSCQVLFRVHLTIRETR